MIAETSSWNCPECGADVSPNAVGCRDCGATKEDGQWLQPESYDGVSFPDDDDFDYDNFIEKEFGEKSGARKKAPIEIFWWVVAVIILFAFATMAFGFF